MNSESNSKKEGMTKRLTELLFAIAALITALVAASSALKTCDSQKLDGKQKEVVVSNPANTHNTRLPKSTNSTNTSITATSGSATTQPPVASTESVNIENLGQINGDDTPSSLGIDKHLQQTYTCYCAPKGQASDFIMGTSIYSDNTSICTAAVHDSLIDFLHGGPVSFIIMGEQSGFRGKLSNGVRSDNHPKHASSFQFIKLRK